MTNKHFIQKFVQRLVSASIAAAGLSLLGAAALSTVAEAKERYAVVIANKNYRHTGPVRFADRDALAIENALVNTMGVPRRNIFKYEDVSMTDLRFLFGDPGHPGQLSNLVSGEDSELFVYFAGHGSKEGDEKLQQATPYILGVDSRPEALRQTAYSLDIMISQLNTLQSKSLPMGRVMLVLESCFSGRSNDGDLVEGRSAPAFGPPITISKRAPRANKNFVMLAAAQGDQYAVWDTTYKRSVFTDAFVSGLYGEADDTRFNGNADGEVTLNELKGFLKRRMSRRLRAVAPGERQDPDVIGGTEDLTLVKVADARAEWSEIIRRSHSEKIRSAMLLSSTQTEDIQSFLTDCLYCPNRVALLEKVNTAKRANTICEIEQTSFDDLMANGDDASIRAYLDVSQCQTHTPKLEKRLASLAGSVTTVASTDASETETGNGGQSELEKRTAERLLARRLQTELKRVGCLYGRVDGVWGRGSAGALKRFVKTAKLDLAVGEPSEELIAAVTAKTEQVCKKPTRTVKKKYYRKPKKVTRTRKRNRRKKQAIINEEVYEPAPKKPKTYKKKKTYSKPKYDHNKATGNAPSNGVYIEKLCSKYGDFCG